MNHSTDQPNPADPAAATSAPPATNSGLLLRQRAEEIARTETPPPSKAALPPPPAAPPRRLASSALVKSIVGHTLHELRVHQIELEMQNEELRQTQAELSAAKTRYFDLYDLAPVGYLTVGEKGLILESNFTAAKLLGGDAERAGQATAYPIHFQRGPRDLLPTPPTTPAHRCSAGVRLADGEARRRVVLGAAVGH